MLIFFLRQTLEYKCTTGRYGPPSAEGRRKSKKESYIPVWHLYSASPVPVFFIRVCLIADQCKNRARSDN